MFVLCRCGSRQSCSVPVNSSIFGDPCPGSSKYVEVHFTCVKVPASTTTPKPRPPWLLDLSATPSTEWKYKTTAVTTTTTTTTSTTAPTTFTTTVTSASTFASQSTTMRPSSSASPRPVTRPPVPQPPSDWPLAGDHCQPASVRGLYWNWTRAGESAIQPCPPGTQGFARWRCADEAVWEFAAPDLSECQAHWITRLETRIRTGDSVTQVASDLAAVTETRPLYGGDLLLVSQVMQSLAHRLRQETRAMADTEHRENLVTELMQSVQRTASSLLEDFQEEAWSDLRPAERASAGTSLILGIEENAILVADTVTNEKNLVDVTPNILSSIRVMEARDAATQHFPSLDSLHLADSARLQVPAESVRGQALNGAVRIIFFLYDKMDRVLPSSTNGVKFLNSAVVSAAVSQGRHSRVSAPLRVTLRHLQVRGVSAPSCMWWDFVGRRWSDDNCQVVQTNLTHTTCHCTQMGNLAVLMEEGEGGTGLAPTPGDLDSEEGPLSMATLVGAVAAVVTGMLLAVIVFFVIRRLNLKTGIHKFITTGRLPCLQCREDKSGGLYPTINASPTSTTLSSGTPTTSTTMSSNYFLNSECQLQDPVILSPVGQQTGNMGTMGTIYRATLANGQQVPVIPVSHIQLQDPRSQYFRPVSPLGHIYMEIDPVYARLDPDREAGAGPGQSDLQLSDVSDDDLRRSSDISRQSSNRYAEERPLIRNTLRKSAPHARPGPGAVRTVSAGLGNSLRMNTKSRAPVLPGPGGQHPSFSRLDTPITIALSPGGEQFVSMNLEQARPGQQPVYQHQPPQRGYHQHSLQ